MLCVISSVFKNELFPLPAADDYFACTVYRSMKTAWIAIHIVFIEKGVHGGIQSGSHSHSHFDHTDTALNRSFI